MNVFWSESSIRHLGEVLRYIEAENTKGSNSTRRRILKTVSRVGQMPYSGRIGRIEGTREAVVPGTPFIAVYEISAHAVEIVGVWHAARLWPDSF